MINDMGIWIQGFSGFCGIASNLLVELSTIWKGLQPAWDLGIDLSSWNLTFRQFWILLRILIEMTFILMQTYFLSL